MKINRKIDDLNHDHITAAIDAIQFQLNPGTLVKNKGKGVQRATLPTPRPPSVWRLCVIEV